MGIKQLIIVTKSNAYYEITIESGLVSKKQKITARQLIEGDEDRLGGELRVERILLEKIRNDIEDLEPTADNIDLGRELMFDVGIASAPIKAIYERTS